ncbi:MAG: dual specificity protein phosphatase family protein, partial [Metallosphaera sp.]
KNEGLNFLHVPIPDGQPPSMGDLDKIMNWLKDGTNVVHCVAGKGRTGTVLAAYLIMNEGLSPDQAVDEVRRYQSGAIATMQQLIFLYELRKIED